MGGGEAAGAWRSLNGGQQPLLELTARAAAAEVDAGMWISRVERRRCRSRRR